MDVRVIVAAFEPQVFEGHPAEIAVGLFAFWIIVWLVAWRVRRL
jgi:hypothetical protein